VPSAHELHTRFTLSVGCVDTLVPVAQVDHARQLAPAASFSGWYLPESHSLQLVDFVSNPKPAEQNEQLVLS
jgi:hypothetical protein